MQDRINENIKASTELGVQITEAKAKLATTTTTLAELDSALNAGSAKLPDSLERKFDTGTCEGKSFSDGTDHCFTKGKASSTCER
jgi:hypothetical protein